ncbi:MAG: GNAT family N-acetyltransferase [Candidatus Hodarchaeota archaeon]
MERIIYRNYREGDENQLADLFNLAFQQNGSGFIRTPNNWYWRYVRSPGFEPEMCQIAEDLDRQKIVGAIIVNLIEEVPIGHNTYLMGDINDVSTHPDYTSRGIATKLMEMAIKYMKQKKCDFSILSTGYKSFAREKIYQRFGFFDVDLGIRFIQFPNVLQLIKNVYALAFFFPVFFAFSYIPRLINRVKLKFHPIFKEFSYNIDHNKKHFEYMNAINKINPKYYEGYPVYTKKKFSWARIKVPSTHQKPTYIIIRKEGEIIGGSVITQENIHSFKFGIKIRIGLIHEIFLEKNRFNNSKNLLLAYIYLIDKIIKAATRRSLSVLMYLSPSKDKDLNNAFNRMNFLKFKANVTMIKQLKANIKFPQIKTPLFVPTYVIWGFP